jgi:cyanophycinase-like exopeptidase
VKAPGAVYLVGDSHAGTLREVFQRIQTTHGKKALRFAVSFAALEGRHGEARARSFAKSLLPDAEVLHFSVDGEQGAMVPSRAREIVERADVLFFGGGDPVLAARRLVASGADGWIRDARARGAVCVGISAGSIALAAYWAAWPDDDPDAPPELVRGVGAAPHVVVDCHAEEDDWSELRAVHDLLGADAKKYVFGGIGHASALVVHADERLEWIGKAMLLGGS